MPTAGFIDESLRILARREAEKDVLALKAMRLDFPNEASPRSAPRSVASLCSGRN